MSFSLTLYDDVELQRRYLELVEDDALTDDDREAMMLDIVASHCNSVDAIQTKVLPFVRSLDTLVSAIKVEKSSLDDKQKRAERIKEGLKSKLIFWMNGRGMKKIDVGTNTMTIAKSHPTEVVDPTLLDREFIKVTVEMTGTDWDYIQETLSDKTLSTFKIKETPMLSAIKDAIKDGREVAGAKIADKDNLRIK
jgi:hypothetical protein